MTKKTKLSTPQDLTSLAEQLHAAHNASAEAAWLYTEIFNAIGPMIDNGSDEPLLQALMGCSTSETAGMLIGLMDDCADSVFGVGADGKELASMLFAIPIVLSFDEPTRIAGNLKAKDLDAIVKLPKSMGLFNSTSSVIMSPKLYSHAELIDCSFVDRSRAARAFAKGLADNRMASPAFSDEDLDEPQRNEAYYLVGAVCVGAEEDPFVDSDPSDKYEVFAAAIIAGLKNSFELKDLSDEHFDIGFPDYITDAVMMSHSQAMLYELFDTVDEILMTTGNEPGALRHEVVVKEEDQSILISLYRADSNEMVGTMRRPTHEREMPEDVVTDIVDMLKEMGVRQRGSGSIKHKEAGAPPGYLLH